MAVFIRGDFGSLVHYAGHIRKRNLGISRFRCSLLLNDNPKLLRVLVNLKARVTLLPPQILRWPC